MANEVVKMYRNTGTDETPVWARWYGEIIAEAVKISGENGEPTAQNIKQYVDAKITALLGSSTPETLDTLEEIATWITNHEEVAEALNQAITSKVPNTRKVNGKALSADITLAAEDVGAIPATQKGAASGVASLGVDGKVPSSQLPSSYPASMITEDDTRRFVTDEEKTAWNNKADIIFASELPVTAPEGAICFLIEDNEE